MDHDGRERRREAGNVQRVTEWTLTDRTLAIAWRADDRAMTDLMDTHVSRDFAVFVREQLVTSALWMDWTKCIWLGWRTGLVGQESVGRRVLNDSQSTRCERVFLFVRLEPKSVNEGHPDECQKCLFVGTSAFCSPVLHQSCNHRERRSVEIHTWCRQWHDTARCTHRHRCFQSFCLDQV